MRKTALNDLRLFSSNAKSKLKNLSKIHIVDIITDIGVMG